MDHVVKDCSQTRGGVGRNQYPQQQQARPPIPGEDHRCSENQDENCNPDLIAHPGPLAVLGHEHVPDESQSQIDAARIPAQKQELDHEEYVPRTLSDIQFQI